MGRVVALDPGTKRIGVAVSDSARTVAFPRPSVLEGPDAIAGLVKIVNDELADLVVVGRPLSLSGTVTPSTEQADRLRLELASALPDISVVAFDERFTTLSANQRLSAAGVATRDQRLIIDSASATVLLQSFLDASDT